LRERRDEKQHQCRKGSERFFPSFFFLFIFLSDFYLKIVAADWPEAN
jgi:hypothetical protein